MRFHDGAEVRMTGRGVGGRWARKRKKMDPPVMSFQMLRNEQGVSKGERGAWTGNDCAVVILGKCKNEQGGERERGEDAQWWC